MLFVRCGTSAQIFSVVWRSLPIAGQTQRNGRMFCLLSQSLFSRPLVYTSTSSLTDNLMMYLWGFNVAGRPGDAAGCRACLVLPELLTVVTWHLLSLSSSQLCYLWKTKRALESFEKSFSFTTGGRFKWHVTEIWPFVISVIQNAHPLDYTTSDDKGNLTKLPVTTTQPITWV